MKKTVCFLFGHHLVPTGSVFKDVHDLKCTHCSDEFTTIENMQLIRLSKLWKDNNAFFEATFGKKI